MILLTDVWALLFNTVNIIPVMVKIKASNADLEKSDFIKIVLIINNVQRSAVAVFLTIAEYHDLITNDLLQNVGRNQPPTTQYPMVLITCYMIS